LFCVIMIFHVHEFSYLVAKLLTCIGEVPGLNLVWHTDYPDSSFRYFLRFLHVSAGMIR
jgi:hypothetical protein